MQFFTKFVPIAHLEGAVQASMFYYYYAKFAQNIMQICPKALKKIRANKLPQMC
jgi:hypothetical protein